MVPHNVLDWPKTTGKARFKMTTQDLLRSGHQPRSNPSTTATSIVADVEIMISGSTDNLPPTSTLQNSMASMFNLTPHGQEGVYVHCSLSPIIAAARVWPFTADGLPAGLEWGAAQQVRMIWAVQALVDVCDDYADGVCSHYSKHNDPQIVHVYPDECA